MTACPANINEFLTFLPQQPKPRPNSTADSNSYTPLELVPPERRLVSSQLYPDLLLNLKDFISGVVNDLGISDMPCQSMQSALKDMARVSFQTERYVSEYGGYVTQAVESVVEAIAGPTVGVRHEPDGFDFNLVIGRDEIEDGHLDWVPLRACSDRDVAYSVLLSEAEVLSRPVSLDATRKQIGANAMVVKLALQMVAANAEYGFFFGGYIAIATQLVKSTDPSRPGLILLLSPAFRLSNEALPILETLTPFQANIQPEPFLAILVAMLCANLVPGHKVKSLPATFYQPLRLIPDGEDEHDSGDNGEGRDGIPACSVQVGTNAMILQHPWLNCSDIHRISIIGNPPQPLPDVQNILAPRNLHRAPRIQSKVVNTVTLLKQIQASRWSSIYTCRIQGDDKLCIMKLVSERHSEMVLRELYMYDVVLKGCSLVPRFYGTFQRPAGGWFGFSLENVGDSLEEVYGLDWGEVKVGLGVAEWKNLVDSVKRLHSLGVTHGDLEPRNVARTREGTFKFFDFGQSEMHRCRRSGCEEVRELLDV